MCLLCDIAYVFAAVGAVPLGIACVAYALALAEHARYAALTEGAVRFHTEAQIAQHIDEELAINDQAWKDAEEVVQGRWGEAEDGQA